MDDEDLEKFQFQLLDRFGRRPRAMEDWLNEPIDLQLFFRTVQDGDELWGRPVLTRDASRLLKSSLDFTDSPFRFLEDYLFPIMGGTDDYTIFACTYGRPTHPVACDYSLMKIRSVSGTFEGLVRHPMYFALDWFPL
jgi:hypothetical protein